MKVSAISENSILECKPTAFMDAFGILLLGYKFGRVEEVKSRRELIKEKTL